MTDHGGFAAEYLVRRAEWEKDGTKVKIIGVCDSSCTLYLALPRDQVCVSKSAWLGFHAPTTNNLLEGLPGTATMKRQIYDVFWNGYSAQLQGRLGSLTADLQYIRGRDLFPVIAECTP